MTMIADHADAATLHRFGALIAGRAGPVDLAQTDWPPLIRLALENNLAPALLQAAKRAGSPPDALPEWGAVVAAWRGSAVRGVYQQAARETLSRAFDAASIPAIWLKGAALAHTAYSKPSMRPMGDLDVLVPLEKREKALETVQALGYDFYLEGDHVLDVMDKAAAERVMHHYHLRGGPQDSIVLEVHWSLLCGGGQLLDRAGHDWFWSQTQTLDGAPRWQAFRPEAQLLHLCAHAMLHHGLAHIGLLHFFDLDRVISAGPLDWGVIVDQADRFGWTFAVGEALRRARDVFGAPVPDSVLRELAARQSGDEERCRVLLLEGKGSQWEGMRRFLARLSWREKLAYALRTAIPPRAYMRNRYAVPAGRAVWPFYLHRWRFQAGEALAWLRKRRAVRRLAKQGDERPGQDAQVG
ncbi:MAG: nucleotidyltransferase family protein [Anaerolineae bacterium]|nr:nucleotidyltransferase family protein [Anaerolineae bacterium]